MTGEGLASLFTPDATAIMGFVQIAPRIGIYLRRIREAAASVVVTAPDVLVIIDSPEFTHRIAKRVRRRAPNIPIVDYVCPSVWAWRPWRARAMRRYIDHVMALLPFEPASLAQFHGPPATYVGHPLSERAAALRPDAAEAKRRDSLPAVVLLMPGSRAGELNRMLPMFESIAMQLAAQAGPVEFVMPVVPALASRIAQAVATWRIPVRVVGNAEDKDRAFRIARLAVVKSGTSTLELAVAGVPMVVTYRVSAIEAFVARRALRISSVVLANLVLGENVVPEFLQEHATPEKIVAAAMALFAEGPQRRQQIDAFNKLDDIMGIGRALPSERAAEIVLAQARKARAVD